MRLGLRSRTPGMDAAIRDLFALHVVDDPDAPPNYSIDHLSTADDPATAIKVAYRDVKPVVRTRSTARLLEGLVRHIAGEHTTSGDRLELRTLALTRGDSAVLVPARLRDRLTRLAPHLRRRGVRVLDEPVARIDPATGQLVVARPELAVDWSVLAGLGSRGLDGASDMADPPVTPGGYRLQGLYLAANAEAPASRANALVAVMPLVRNNGLLEGRVLLGTLAALVRTCPVQPLPKGMSPADLAAALRARLDGE